MGSASREARGADSMGKRRNSGRIVAGLVSEIGREVLLSHGEVHMVRCRGGCGPLGRLSLLGGKGLEGVPRSGKALSDSVAIRKAQRCNDKGEAMQPASSSSRKHRGL